MRYLPGMVLGLRKTGLYFVGCYFSTLVVVWLALGRRKPTTPGIFLGALLASFWLCRLFNIRYNREVDPDESMLLGQALTLRKFPIIFDSVDPSTGGPFLSYLLTIPNLAGFPIDYVTAHFLAALLLSIGLIFTFLTLKIWYGDRVSQMAILPGLVVYSYSPHSGFNHYSSELLSIAVLSAALYCYSLITVKRNAGWWLYFLLGFLLGIIPYCKLQAVPIALVIGFFGLLEAYSKAKLGRETLALVAGALAVPLGFMLFMGANDALGPFFEFYIKGNLAYTDTFTDQPTLVRFLRFFVVSFNLEKTISLFLVILLPSFVYFALFIPRKYSLFHNRHLLFLVLFFGSAIYAVVKSGAFFIHYYNYIFFSGMVVHAYFLQVALRKSVRAIVPIQFGILFIAVMVLKQGESYNRNTGLDKAMITSVFPAGNEKLPTSDMAKVIRKFTKPDEPMALWGWETKYYVEAQRIQATKLNHSDFGHFQNKGNFRKIYMEDISRSRPPVFLDSYDNEVPSHFWHEKFPELRAFISKNYAYYGKIDKIRIYLRKDLLTQPAAVNARP